MMLVDAESWFVQRKGRPPTRGERNHFNKQCREGTLPAVKAGRFWLVDIDGLRGARHG